MYKAKYTLSDLLNSGVLEELFSPIPHKNSEGKEDRLLNTFDILSLISNLCLSAVVGLDSQASVSAIGNSHIRVKTEASVEEAYEKVLSTLQANKTLLQTYASHSQELTSALNSQLKFDSKNKDKGKLYLRINNLEEVRTMTPRQKKALLDNIVENIYFNKDFAKAQASLGLRGKNNRAMFFTSLSSSERKGYSTLRREWERKVGYNGI